jgi:putative two-component system response regulator
MVEPGLSHESPLPIAPIAPERSLPPSPATAIPDELRSSRVAIVDDQPLIVRVLRRQLAQLGYRDVLGLCDSSRALQELENFRPDVVLLDIVMPDVSGTDLLRQLRRHSRLKDVPVIVLSASTDRLTRLEVVELAVSDFLTKPADEAELAARLRNVLQARQYREHLCQWAQTLEIAVRERTRALEQSRRDVVLCLARAAEFRDDTTGRHVIRVGRYAAILAEAMGLPPIIVDIIELAAQLHDVGKIGIPDAVLHKPGPLTAEELAIMRQHAAHGYTIVAPSIACDAGTAGFPRLDMLSDASSPMLVMAAQIALSHHEHWDGSGYPRGLAGENIPLEARITSVADVFDALSTERRYKPAFPVARCREIISAQRGRQFDPNVVDAFFAASRRIEETYEQLADRKAPS